MLKTVIKPVNQKGNFDILIVKKIPNPWNNSGCKLWLYGKYLKCANFFSWILAVRERFFRKISSKNHQTQKLLSNISRVLWLAQVSALKYWTPWCVAQKQYMEPSIMDNLYYFETTSSNVYPLPTAYTWLYEFIFVTIFFRYRVYREI